MFSLTKISLLIFLLRLGGTSPTGVRISIVSLIVLNMLQLIACFMATILQCSPVQVAWTWNWDEGTCTDEGALAISTAALEYIHRCCVASLAVRGIPLLISRSISGCEMP